MKLLGADSGGSINTAYIERLNLTIRNSLARFVRKTMNSSKSFKEIEDGCKEHLQWLKG